MVDPVRGLLASWRDLLWRRRASAVSPRAGVARTPLLLTLGAASLVGLVTFVQAGGSITSITPACAPTGATVVITGHGFGAQNVTVQVGGVLATVVSATGNRVTFLVPNGVPPGVTTVTATNPGGQAGSIAFRVQGPEICGNGSDDDCNGIVDDPSVCQHVNHPPVANAGAGQTAPVGATVHLDGTGSSDPDGDALSLQWTLTARPSGSAATLVGAATATPSLTLDKAGSYTVQLVVNDGSLSSVPSTVVLSTSNSAPVANAGPNQSSVVGATITLNGSGSSDVDGDPLTYAWSLSTRPPGSTAALRA